MDSRNVQKGFLDGQGAKRKGHVDNFFDAIILMRLFSTLIGVGLQVITLLKDVCPAGFNELAF